MQISKLSTCMIGCILSVCSTLALASEPVIGSSRAEAILAKPSDDASTSDLIAKTQLQTAYMLNPELNRYNIKTEVINGQVDITGAVQSELEKQLAIDIAKDVNGIDQIQADNLTIDPHTKRGEITSDFGKKITDTTITAMVKTKLLADSRVSGTDIEVSTINNIVTLSGKAKTSTERSVAGEIAISTPGVSSVKNALTINK